VVIGSGIVAAGGGGGIAPAVEVALALVLVLASAVVLDGLGPGVAVKVWISHDLWSTTEPFVSTSLITTSPVGTGPPLWVTTMTELHVPSPQRGLKMTSRLASVSASRQLETDVRDSVASIEPSTTSCPDSGNMSSMVLWTGGSEPTTPKPIARAAIATQPRTNLDLKAELSLGEELTPAKGALSSS